MVFPVHASTWGGSTSRIVDRMVPGPAFPPPPILRKVRNSKDSSCHGSDPTLLELYRCEHPERIVTTLAVVEDLEVLEDRVRQNYRLEKGEKALMEKRISVVQVAVHSSGHV